MTFLIECLVVFFAMMALDFIFAEYTKTTADRKPFIASSWASVIIVLSGYITTLYVGDPWLLIPAAFGAFSGTYLSVRRKV